jgi:hypothetical protein
MMMMMMTIRPDQTDTRGSCLSYSMAAESTRSRRVLISLSSHHNSPIERNRVLETDVEPAGVGRHI